MKILYIIACIVINWNYLAKSEEYLYEGDPKMVHRFMAFLSALADQERIIDINVDSMRTFYGIFQPFDPSSISFLLWTRSNPTDDEVYELKWNDEDSVNHSAFDGKKRTYFAFHGWENNGTADYILKSKSEILTTEDANFISVDWEELAHHDVYFPSALYVFDVADYTARFINFLIEKTDLVPANLHLWGHSLGAHIAGITAHLVEGEVDRVTGLDPAAPLFSMMSSDHRIDSSNAAFVDIIHTSGVHIPDIFGMHFPLGHVDFYPNGADPQSGCSGKETGTMDIISGCSHTIAHEFFLESLKRGTPFVAFACDSFEAFVAGQCQSDVQNIMGIDASRAKPGKYYLFTNPAEPYAQGMLQQKYTEP